METTVLQIDDLSVHYGRRIAVNHLSLSLDQGEIVALLGPNGAGKSTALLACAGAVISNGGQVQVDGASLSENPVLVRKHIGFADQPPSLYEYYTVFEHVHFVGKTRGADDAEEVRSILASLGLSSIADRYCRELSFGMRQRVGLAAALVGDVKVVLLDETLNGLDPRAAVMARDTIRQAAKRGVTVLMSTHLLGVAERLCDRVVIMDAGELKKDVSGDPLQSLLSKGPGAIEELYLSLVTSSEPS